MTTTPTVDYYPVLTATVRQDEKPIRSKTVTFTIASGIGKVTPITATTDASGQATATLSSTVPGTVAVEASADPVTATETVNFSVGAPSTVTLTADPYDPTVDVSSTLTARVVDQYSNPVPGETVTFSVTSGTVTPTTDTTNAQGQATTTISSEAVGIVTVQAMADSVTDTKTVSFSHGAPVRTELTPVMATVAAEYTQTYTVTAFDQHDNPWDVTVGSLFSTTDPRGAFEANVYTAGQVGDWIQSASYESLTATADVTVIHGDPVRIEIAPRDTTIKAEYTQVYTATAFDSEDNPWDVTADAQFGTTDPCGYFTDNVYYACCVGNWTQRVSYAGLEADCGVTVPPISIYLPLVLKPNHPPYTPSTPIPASDATGQPIDVDLSWTGGDPDPGDAVTYDVYFGTSCPPPDLICDDVPTPECDPGTLDYDTTYYWYVLAHDDGGEETRGPEEGCWDFTTETEICPCKDIYETNDDWGERCKFRLESNQPLYSYICEEHIQQKEPIGKEYDYYCFEIAHLDTITIDLIVPDVVNYDLFLWGPGFSDWEGSDDPTPGGDESLVWNPTRKGEYVVVVKSSGDHDNCNPYTLTAIYD
ncbi:MAG: Ig-like domain-containing protein [Chloroflexota bacterium]|nr:Ig-like domain-containing protein [Chloroflexota bacterium]